MTIEQDEPCELLKDKYTSEILQELLSSLGVFLPLHFVVLLQVLLQLCRGHEALSAILEPAHVWFMDLHVLTVHQLDRILVLALFFLHQVDSCGH